MKNFSMPAGSLTQSQGVVEARGADADHVPRERVGVVGADLEAVGRHVAVELDLVVARQGDADAVADLGVLARHHALDRVAEGGRLDLDVGDVLGGLALEAGLDHADATPPRGRLSGDPTRPSP